MGFISSFFLKKYVSFNVFIGFFMFNLSFLLLCLCLDIEFKEGDKQHVVEVEVLFDGVREMRESFTLHLKPDENMVAETQVRKLFILFYFILNLTWDSIHTKLKARPR